MAKTIQFRVYEIEHASDLNDAFDAVARAGGYVTGSTDINEDSESAVLTVSIPDAFDAVMFRRSMTEEGVIL